MTKEVSIRKCVESHSLVSILHSGERREGMIVNKHTSHLYNIKAMKYYATQRLLCLVDLRPKLVNLKLEGVSVLHVLFNHLRVVRLNLR